MLFNQLGGIRIAIAFGKNAQQLYVIIQTQATVILKLCHYYYYSYYLLKNETINYFTLYTLHCAIVVVSTKFVYFCVLLQHLRQYERVVRLTVCRKMFSPLNAL